MNAAQQHLLDTYRAARRTEAAPPAPGTHTVRTAREIRGWFRFQAVVTDPGDRLAGRVRRYARRAGCRGRAVVGGARRLVRLLQV
ncbi:hypothetical protein ACFVZM_09320 [Streptomyces sioyaensis]|uniref:hypothetical protein n=1 Tax=Streptomyces sioyaensis TaxID=67364 RepID=UPI00369C3839